MKNQFEGPLKIASDLCLRYLDDSQTRRVAARASLEELRNKLVKPLQDAGMNAEEVIKELADNCEDGILASSGPKFFGWVVGGSLPSALAADWMTSTWDQNAALFACAPAAAVVEEVVGSWLKQLLPVSPRASFALVTGTQMAHVTCLAAARHGLLKRLGLDVEHLGLAESPRIRIIANSQIHGSVLRAIRLLGLGQQNVIQLSTDNSGRVQAKILEEALQSGGSTPTIVILQAGDINTGTFDPFAELIPLSHHAGSWVHVDGAFGLWAGASPRFAHLLKGVELADSWTVDGHKWLNVPYDCGYAFVNDKDAHTASMSHRAVYLTHDEDARDEMDWTPEWSRRGRGFSSYAALRQLGRSGVAELVERSCLCAYELTVGLGRIDGIEVLWEPILNQGLVRFSCPVATSTELDHDRFTDHVIEQINRAGDMFFTGTTWQGKRAMRISVCNWQTTESTVVGVIKSVSDTLTKLRSGYILHDARAVKTAADL